MIAQLSRRSLIPTGYRRASDFAHAHAASPAQASSSAAPSRATAAATSKSFSTGDARDSINRCARTTSPPAQVS